MRTNVELLMADQKSHMLPEEARGEILDDVAAQLGEFSSLIGDLVQLSREDAPPPRPEYFDLSDAVSKAVERGRRRGPNLEFDVHLESHLVLGDEATLERAVTNLLDNAVKFSPAGGTVTVTMEGDTVIVSDEGPGITEADLPHIFDRFYRSDRARNTPEPASVCRLWLIPSLAIRVGSRRRGPQVVAPCSRCICRGRNLRLRNPRCPHDRDRS